MSALAFQNLLVEISKAPSISRELHWFKLTESPTFIQANLGMIWECWTAAISCIASMWKWGAVVYDRPLGGGGEGVRGMAGWEISWSQMWPFHQRSPKSHQWFHQISTNSIALTCTHSSNNVQVTFISLCESVTLSPRPPVRRKKDRLRSGIRFLLLAQNSFSEICLLSDYRNYTPSLALQGVS